MQQHAEDADPDNADQGGERERQVITDKKKIHRVHAEHDQLGVADPYDVDDAEYQVEPERQQPKDAAQQQTVHQRLEQVDIKYSEHGAALSSPVILRFTG